MKEEKIIKKLAEFKEYKNQESIDNYSGTYEEKIRKCIDDNFKKTINDYERIDKKSLKNLCLSGEQFRKRRKIVEKYAVIAGKKYADKYPEISIEYEFIALNAAPSFANYDRINDIEFIYQAAALYVLSNVDNCGKIDELKAVLPKDEETISKAIVHPEAKDLCYSDELVASLVSLFQSQNEYNEKTDELYTLTKNYTEDKITKNYVKDNFDNDKEKVLYILSLVKEYNTKTAIDKFKKDCWNLIELYLKYEEFYQKEIIDHENRMVELVQELRKVLNNKNNVLLINKDESDDELKIRVIASTLNELIDINDDIYNGKHLLRLALTCLYFDNNILEEEVEDEIKEEILKYEIDNPFETCFAFVYLLSTGDDFIWLLNICMSILKIAAEKLPWNKDVNYALENNEEEIKANEERFKKIEFNDEEDIAFENENREFLTDFYKLKYTDAYHWQDVKNAKENDLLKWNLSQFIFDYTGIILPQNIVNLDYKKDGLIKSNFKKEELDILTILMQVLDLYQCRETLALDTKENEEELKTELDFEQLKQANKEKTKKIKALQNNIADLTFELNDLKKKYELKFKEQETNNNELYRLREQIYSIQNEDQFVVQEPVVNVTYPYTAKRRTVVIGGNDVWINKMKEKLNNVTFMSSSVKLNMDVLKTAEVVWIQTISMKHADFYALTSFNDKRKLPVHYFSFSNIEKCLQQFIKEDN